MRVGVESGVSGVGLVEGVLHFYLMRFLRDFVDFFEHTIHLFTWF